ncbi:MAG: alanine--tRNA ligase-related protein, partial [Candidatus Zixiibacteriota bacterium]
RILRRAARHGRLLDMHEPFIYRLVPVLVNEMGDTYPEIKEKQEHIERVIRSEEESFCRTLDTGCELFDKIAKKAKSDGVTVIDGKDVFKLYDTYGFPYDLTEIMATERGLTLDKEGFDAALERQKEKSRAGTDFSGKAEINMKEMLDTLEMAGFPEEPTVFVRGEHTPAFEIDTVALAATTFQFREFESLETPDTSHKYASSKYIAVLLKETPFYVESGGQVDDTGTIESDEGKVVVEKLVKHKDCIIHVGRLEKGRVYDFGKGTKVSARIDAGRRWDIMRNHTATHLTHAALRKVLGSHIKQSGSYVGPERLRFDFSHHQPMTPEEIQAVEGMVNEQILKGMPVRTEIMDIESARKSGAVALFGEKYGDTVRVVSIADFSKELCGGTHVDNTSQIGPFFITLETGIASGVRRLEAITGREAIKYMLAAKRFRREAAAIIGRSESEALESLRQLRENNLTLQKEIKKLKADLFSGVKKSVGEEHSVGSLTVVTHYFEETDPDVMAAWIDTQKARQEAVVAFGLGIINGKTTYMASASHRAVSQLHIDVGRLSRQLLPQFGGRGGGKPSFAQGTVAQGTKPQELFEAAGLMIKKEVEKSNE